MQQSKTFRTDLMVQKKPTVDEIKDAITGIIDLGDEEHIWITVTPQDDGSFVVSVIQSGGQTNDVAGALQECTKSQN